MSTKVRYVLALGGYYKGAAAVQILKTNLPEQLQPKTPMQLAKRAAACGAKLWMFREPRGVPYYRSRYKQLCAKLGIARNLKAKKKVAINYQDLLQNAVPPIPQNGNHPNLGQAAGHQHVPAGGLEYVIHHPIPNEPY